MILVVFDGVQSPRNILPKTYNFFELLENFGNFSRNFRIFPKKSEAGDLKDDSSRENERLPALLSTS